MSELESFVVKDSKEFGAIDLIEGLGKDDSIEAVDNFLLGLRKLANEFNGTDTQEPDITIEEMFRKGKFIEDCREGYTLGNWIKEYCPEGGLKEEGSHTRFVIANMLFHDFDVLNREEYTLEDPTWYKPEAFELTEAQEVLLNRYGFRNAEDLHRFFKLSWDVTVFELFSRDPNLLCEILNDTSWNYQEYVESYVDYLGHIYTGYVEPEVLEIHEALYKRIYTNLTDFLTIMDEE